MLDEADGAALGPPIVVTAPSRPRRKPRATPSASTYTPAVSPRSLKSRICVAMAPGTSIVATLPRVSRTKPCGAPAAST
jgi:hypothetical protein